MSNNKQQTEVDVAELAMKLYPFGNSERNAFITGYNKAKEMEKEQIIRAVDELCAYVDSMQNAYVELSKKDKKKSKQVDTILTATTLIKMKIQSLNK